jgi:hypothetical protein
MAPGKRNFFGFLFSGLRKNFFSLTNIRMSSVIKVVAQVPKGGDYFVAYQAGGATGTMLNEANLPTSSSTGYVSNVGTSFVFSSAANANTAINASAAPVAEGDTFVDMGKKYYIYVNSSTGGIPMIYAVLNKVRRVGDLATAGGSYEGGDGAIGYVVTWSAAPGTTAVAVIRSGRTNGAW